VNTWCGWLGGFIVFAVHCECSGGKLGLNGWTVWLTTKDNVMKCCKPVEFIRMMLAALGVLFLLSSCGGGGDGPQPGGGGTFEGIWSGETVSSANGSRIKLNGMALRTGEMLFFAYQDGHVFNGSWASNGGILSIAATAQWKDYMLGEQVASPVGWAQSAGSPQLQQVFNASGGFTEKQKASLSYNASLGDAGSVNFFYWDIYDRPSSLSKLVGAYTNASDLTITISADGTFIGSEVASNGFGNVTRNYSGRFRLIDPTKNLYSLQLNVGSILMNGYAFMVDSAVGKTDDAIQLAAIQSSWGPFVHYWKKR